MVKGAVAVMKLAITSQVVVNAIWQGRCGYNF